MNNFDSFVFWEAKSRDTIDFKKIYVDIAGDLIAGLLLSQIIYWYLPDSQGNSKLRVEKDGHLWIAKGREEWYEEIRISPKQFDRAASILVKKGILVKDTFMFDGFRTVHIRLDQEKFIELWDAQIAQFDRQRGKPVLTKGEDRSLPKGKTGVDERVRPITETTTKTTTKILPASQNFSSEGNREEDQDHKAALNELASYVADNICNIAIGMVSEKTRDQLKKITLALYRQDVTKADLDRFGEWWYACHWKGKKLQPPAPTDIGDSWGEFESWQVKGNEVRVVNSDGSLNI